MIVAFLFFFSTSLLLFIKNLHKTQETNKTPNKNFFNTSKEEEYDTPHLTEAKSKKKTLWFFPRYTGLMAILGFLPVFINNVVCHYLLFILERYIVYNIYRYIANIVNLIYIDNIVTIFKTERSYTIYLSIYHALTRIILFLLK